MIDKETEALAKFREAVADLDFFKEPREDYFLLRWLRARNLDVEKATAMLQKYFEWRANNEDLKIISSIHWSPDQMVLDRIKLKHTGYDHDGRPIFFADSGRWELGQIHDAGHKDDLFRYAYKIMDSIIMPIVEQQRKAKNVSQFIFILNTSGVTLRKAMHIQSAQTRIRFVREFEAYFPEVLHSCYLVNAHWVITNLYKVLSPFISTYTQSKVNLFGTNEEEWKKSLVEKFPADSIPADYGGTAENFSIVYDN